MPIRKHVHFRILRGNPQLRSQIQKIKYPANIPLNWRGGRPPNTKIPFHSTSKGMPKFKLSRPEAYNRHVDRPIGNQMNFAMKYSRLSALATFMGYRFPMKLTRDETLCIYRYYLPPPQLMRVNRRDWFGSHFPNEWIFMNNNRLYNAKYHQMMSHLLIKGRNQNNKNGDMSMMLINEGVLLNSYPHPLLPLLRAYMQQQTIEFASYQDYEAMMHLSLTAMFVPDTGFFLRYAMPYIFFDRRNIKFFAQFFTEACSVKTLHLIQFYNRTFVRKMAYRYTKLGGFGRDRISLADKEMCLYRDRRPVEDYMKFEVPPYEDK